MYAVRLNEVLLHKSIDAHCGAQTRGAKAPVGIREVTAVTLSAKEGQVRRYLAFQRARILQRPASWPCHCEDPTKTCCMGACRTACRVCLPR